MIKRIADLISDFRYSALGKNLHDLVTPAPTPFSRVCEQVVRDINDFVRTAGNAGVNIAANGQKKGGILHYAVKVEGNDQLFHISLRDKKDGGFSLRGYPLTMASAVLFASSDLKSGGASEILEGVRQFLYVNVLDERQQGAVAREIMRQDTARERAEQSFSLQAYDRA